MDEESVLLAKVAALKKSFSSTIEKKRLVGVSQMEPLIIMYKSLMENIKKLNPVLYGDMPNIALPEYYSEDRLHYWAANFNNTISSIDYVLDVSSQSRIGEKTASEIKHKRIFITHGRSKEWYKIQTFLERTMDVPTLELAQEANIGRTVLQKLDEESNKCSIAVIVMTGDDIDADGTLKARENVMHEIGFFQGKYGLGNVIMLHENGVNIPTNIQGLVYISFPKDTAEAAEGALARELKVLLPNR